jgi:hypothetical protein
MQWKPAALLGAALVLVRADDRGSSESAWLAPARPDANLPSHADDVADYTLRATLDAPAHLVHGEGTIRWRNTSARAVRELWMHLYLNAFKNERSAFFRERVGGRGTAVPEDWGAIDLRRLDLADADGSKVDLLPRVETHRPGDEDETDARIDLPSEVAPGETLRLEVAFDDKLPRVIERTGYEGSFHMVGQWFPKIARLERDGTWAHFAFHHLSEFYSDFGTYDVTLDVPADYVIGATGPAAEVNVADGRRRERHLQSDIHDFAWTAWDRWQTDRERIDGVEVTVLYPPGYEAMADRERAALRFALPYDSRRYGRYPYPTLTVVHPPQSAREAGGMEYPTLITSGAAWWTPSGLRLPEIVTVHELGHQWFYGMVATNEAAWPFLDEGLNQYAEGDTLAKWLGAGSAVDLWGMRVGDAEVQAAVGNRAAHDERVAQPADSFSTGASYAAIVYSRTAAVLETFARVYGDEAVALALGSYTRRNRFSHPGPEDLLAAFSDALGPSAARTLREALFDKAWVDYAVDAVFCQPAESPAGIFDEGGRTTKKRAPDSGWEGSVLVRRRGSLSFPVEIELVMADGSKSRQTWDAEGDFVRIPWRGSTQLVGAVVDPDGRILVDADPQNNAARVSPGVLSAPRTLERALYFGQLVLGALAP